MFECYVENLKFGVFIGYVRFKEVCYGGFYIFYYFIYCNIVLENEIGEGCFLGILVFMLILNGRGKKGCSKVLFRFYFI